MTNLNGRARKLLEALDQMLDKELKIGIKDLQNVSQKNLEMVQQILYLYDETKDYILYETRISDEMSERVERLERQNDEILKALRRIEAK